jgi:PAS domain S-box-containing protein
VSANTAPPELAWHHLSDAVVVADADGNIAFWNLAAETLFGWSAAEAIGKSLELIIPVRLRQRHTTAYRRVMDTGETAYSDRLLEVPAIHRDGHTLSVAFTVTLLISGGHPTGVVAVIRDDTERRNERQELRRLRDASHSSPPNP